MMWKRIEEDPRFRDTPLYTEDVPFPVHEVDAYCHNCLGEIKHYQTGYVSWPSEHEGQPCIDSGYKSYSVVCPHCGTVNDPQHKVILSAIDKDTGQVCEYGISVASFFNKTDYRYYKEEYDKEGELVFIIRR